MSDVYRKKYLPVCIKQILKQQKSLQHCVIKSYKAKQSQYVIELCHLDVHNFVIEAISQMWLYLLDVISLSIMSGRNNM